MHIDMLFNIAQIEPFVKSCIKGKLCLYSYKYRKVETISHKYSIVNLTFFFLSHAFKLTIVKFFVFVFFMVLVFLLGYFKYRKMNQNIVKY